MAVDNDRLWMVTIDFSSRLGIIRSLKMVKSEVKVFKVTRDNVGIASVPSVPPTSAGADGSVSFIGLYSKLDDKTIYDFFVLC